MSEMKCKRCGANENRIHGFCSMECETAWEYEDEIRDLTACIAELEEKQRWIPVSERLPKESGWYRVGAINVFYEGYTDEVYFEANKTKSGWQSSVRDEIYCWLDGVPEMPELPEVQQ